MPLTRTAAFTASGLSLMNPLSSMVETLPGVARRVLRTTWTTCGGALLVTHQLSVGPEFSSAASTLLMSVWRSSRSGDRPELAMSAWYWARVVSLLTVVKSPEVLVASVTVLAAAADAAPDGIAMAWTRLAKADM